MKNKIKAAINRNGYILTIGVDPAMSKPMGIAIIRYFPATMKTEPIITRTFAGTKHAEIVDFLESMKLFLAPDEVVAIGSESSYRGQFPAIPYALGMSRGIIEGVAACQWKGIITEYFKVKEWRALAFGSGTVSKYDAFLTCNADFHRKEYPDATIIGELTEDASEAYHIARATAIRLTSE